MNGKKVEEPTAASETTSEGTSETPVAEEKPAQPPQEFRQVIALCEKCNKPIYEPTEVYRITVNKAKEVRCKECFDKHQAQLKREAEIRRQQTIEYAKNQRAKSYIFGALSAIVAFFVFLWVTTGQDMGTEYVVGGCIAGVLFFPFISCLFLKNNFIMDMVEGVCSWGFIKLPGLIFTLDLDGIIWLLTVKLAFWVLGLMLSIACFILAIILGLVVSVFVYPFALSKSIHHPEETEYL